jgi:hypothetical protein
MAEQAHESGNEGRFESEEHQAESAFWQFSQDVAGTLLKPGETLRDIGRRQAIISAIALVVLIVIVSVTGQAVVLFLNLAQVSGFQTETMPFQTAPVAAMQITGILWNLVWGPVLWTIVAASLFGCAWLLGGRGNFASLWAASGFALVPQLLVAPLNSVNQLLGSLGTGWQIVGGLVLVPATIAGFIWTVALFVIAVRETMALSTGRSIGAVAILFGGLMMLGILLACVFIIVFGALAAAVMA